MTLADRYSRQIAVLGVGPKGQAAIRRATVQVRGAGLDSELCALYLAGAGVSLVIHPTLKPRCRAINSEVELTCSAEAGPLVQLASDSFTPAEEDPVMRGSLAARWALAKVLGGC